VSHSLKAKLVYLRGSDKLSTAFKSKPISTTFNIYTHPTTTVGKFPLVKCSLIIRKTSAHLGQNIMFNAVFNHTLLEKRAVYTTAIQR
jgi:hypothetical protein